MLSSKNGVQRLQEGLLRRAIKKSVEVSCAACHALEQGGDRSAARCDMLQPMHLQAAVAVRPASAARWQADQRTSSSGCSC